MKYKRGDYLTAPDLVFLEVIAAIDGDMPVYLFVGPKGDVSNDDKWFSEKELELLKWEKSQPDFAKWEKIQPGDLVRVDSGQDNNGSYKSSTRKVMVRIGDAVLLSLAPKKPREVKAESDLLKQLEELSGEADRLKQTDPDTAPVVEVAIDLVKRATHKHPYQKILDNARIGSKAYDMAGGWYSVRQLALMNWDLLGAEEE